MKIKITVPVPNGDPFVTHAEVSEDGEGETANAIRDALDLARKQNPGCSINSNSIKLERRGPDKKDNSN